MLPNKRIHELLEYIKEQKKRLDEFYEKDTILFNKERYDSIYHYNLIQIIQHLLEVDIERRKSKEDDFINNNTDDILDKPIEYINEIWLQEHERQGIYSLSKALSGSAIRSLKKYLNERNQEYTIRNILNIPPEYLCRYDSYEDGEYKGVPRLDGFGVVSWNNLHYTLHKAGFRYALSKKSQEDKEHNAT